MLVLVGGLLLRLAVTLVSLCGAGLSTGEKLLMSLAWLPKTTAQATLGSVLLDVSHKYEAEPLYEMGEQILSLSVLSTLLTVPLGSLAITIMGPYLLSKDSQDTHTNQASKTDSEEATITHVRKSLNININQNFLWITG